MYKTKEFFYQQKVLSKIIRYIFHQEKNQAREEFMKQKPIGDWDTVTCFPSGSLVSLLCFSV
jgi:hypothetical protein